MAESTICPHCGSPAAAGVSRCATCGARLRAPAPSTSQTPADNAPQSLAAPPAGTRPAASVAANAGTAGDRNAPRPSAPQPGVAPAPGYPAYPQGFLGYQPPYPAAPPYPYAYPYPYYYPPVMVPYRRAPGETYALVVSWIVTVLGGLSILGGLFALLIGLGLSIEGLFSSLLFVDLVLTTAVAGIGGGAYAMVAGIFGILRRPSPRFSMPRAWLFVALSAGVLVAGVLLWNLQTDGPGAALAIWPLNVLSAALPALALLAFVAWRLHFPTSRRHVWLAVVYGLTLGPLIAIILELLVTLAIKDSLLSNPNSLNLNDPSRVITLLIEISIAAPLVEELVKPLAAVLIMPRLRTASGAFLVGLAAGIGFAVFESVFTYIGTGEADWVNVALQRVGSSILHGLGAGMVALGWFYVFHGKGVSRRWLRVLGCFAYAVLQHAINNASAILLEIIPGPLGTWLAQPFYLGNLPMQIGILPFYGLDAIMFGVLVVVTGRLARGDQHGAKPSALAAPPPIAPAVPAVMGGGTR